MYTTVYQSKLGYTSQHTAYSLL